MKIYFESKSHHGRAMMRVEKAIKNSAPEGLSFTADLNQADVQFLHMIGTGELLDLTKEKFVLFPYCFEAMDKPTLQRAQVFFGKAVMVFSYLNIPKIIDTDNFNFLNSPLGVDTNVFKNYNLSKDVCITTTGYVSGSEAIAECVEASARLGRNSIHIGGDLTSELGYNLCNKYPNLYNRKELITDEELVNCYNRSSFVSGLRRFEGFEFPILEGIMCGARPICFDIDCYRQWFGNLPIYVPQCDYTELIGRLIDIMSTPSPITEEEYKYVVDTFSWNIILTNFWNNFKKYLG
jgi:glycosyltransferase involved in cell wall biosynthesis